MDVKMKKTVIKNLVVGAVCLVVGIGIGKKATVQTVENKKPVVESAQMQELKPVEEIKDINEIQTKEVYLTRVLTKENNTDEDIVLGEGEIYYEYNDGSWAIADFGKNKFEFQPVEMGDWSIDVDNYEQLKDVVYTFVDQETSLRLTGSMEEM